MATLTTRTDVRLRARPASTRRRMLTSDRADSASMPSSSPRRFGLLSAASRRAATTRSHVGSSTRWANSRRATTSRSRSSRTARAATSRRSAGGATGALAMIDCSRPPAAAIVSRSISAHEATPSITDICRSSSARPPTMLGSMNPPAATRSAATGHWVSPPITAPATTARAMRRGSRSTSRFGASRRTSLRRGRSSDRSWPSEGDEQEEAAEAGQRAEEDDGGRHVHQPPGRFMTLGSKPAATRSSRFRFCIGEAGTARRSGPGAKISFELTIVPSAPATSRIDET